MPVTTNDLSSQALQAGRVELDWPAVNAKVITASADGGNLDTVTRAIYVGGVGDVEVDMQGVPDGSGDPGTEGNEKVLFSAVPAGTILPIRVTAIYSGNTTATLIVALW